MAPRDPRRMAFVLADRLLRGEVFDRSRAADLLGIERPAAWDYVKLAAQTIRGARLLTKGRSQQVQLFGVRHGAPETEVVVAACFAASLGSLFEGSVFQHGIREALDYVLEASPQPEKFVNFRRKFFFVRRGGEGALPENRKFLERIVRAVVDEREVDAEYQHFDQRMDNLRLQPLSLVIYDHQLYLVGREVAGDEQRTHLLRFSRIKAVRILRHRRFTYPEPHEFDPDRLFRSSFGIFTGNKPEVVQVRLKRKWAVYAKSHRWHPTQEVAVNKNGVTVTLLVGVCRELEAWVLSFGDEAEVIRPQSLRRRVARRLERAADTYT